MKLKQSKSVYILVRLFCASMLAGVLTFHVHAEGAGNLDAVDGTGWHSWSVPAVENAPSRCCYTWDKKDVQSTACHLDDEKISYGTSTDRSGATATQIQIFARLDNAAVQEVRTFDSTCRVNTKSRVVNHGNVELADSLDFLAKLLEGEHRLASQSLAAIAVHDSNRAQQLLESSTGTAKPVRLRKDAIFWMGQVRAQQSSVLLKRLMLNDNVDKVREHAVFSVSQSNLKDRLDLIEKVARTDDSKKVRGQAWFWMAQTNDAEAEQRIFAGIEAESSRKVKEQAVFALSQLEGDTGTTALIRVVETPELSRKVRKQALFWLAQSDSDRATRYLANVLDR